MCTLSHFSCLCRRIDLETRERGSERERERERERREREREREREKRDYSLCHCLFNNFNLKLLTPFVIFSFISFLTEECQQQIKSLSFEFFTCSVNLCYLGFSQN